MANINTPNSNINFNTHDIVWNIQIPNEEYVVENKNEWYDEFQNMFSLGMTKKIQIFEIHYMMDQSSETFNYL